jgi:hypothetical protein
MALKSTDMVKNLAKKLDGKMKTAGIPDRFAQGATAAVVKRERLATIPASKLVPVSYRLPAELVSRLRDRAAEHSGGVNDLVALALTAWLDTEKK